MHRLIQLSAGLPVFEAEVDSLREIDTPYWSQPGAAPDSVRQIVTQMRFVVAVDPEYPIILGHDGRVMDGMHRIAKALLEELTTIQAVQFRDPIDPDYRGVMPQDLRYD